MPGLLLASLILTTTSIIGSLALLYRSDALDGFGITYSILVSLGMGFMPLTANWVFTNWGSNALVGVALLDFLIIGVLYPPFYDFEPTRSGGAILRIVNSLCLPIIVLAGLMVYNTLPYFGFWVVNALFTTIMNIRAIA